MIFFHIPTFKIIIFQILIDWLAFTSLIPFEAIRPEEEDKRNVPQNKTKTILEVGSTFNKHEAIQNYYSF